VSTVFTAGFFIVTAAERELDKRITRAVMEYRLIDPGDRVLIALSGGKDSLALAWNLARKARGFPVPFSVEALHIDTGFADPRQPERLRELLAGWGLNLRVVRHPAVEEAEAGRPPSCFGCARSRRRILLETAAAEGFNKIALGHHMDDSLTTLLMNMSWNGKLAAMPPMLRVEEGSPSIIRPLILLQESAVLRLVKEAGWTVEHCECPWAGDSRRAEFSALLKDLTGGSPRRMLNLWKSLSDIRSEFLPPGKNQGGEQ
jgi:tRNA(Ile)-lysidine synthase TilS/MesJ